MRGTLADLKVTIPLFRLLLSEDDLEGLNLEGLEMEKESFIDEGLQELITDMLFSAPFADAPSCISILVEHKSQGAARASGADMAWQLRCQEMAVMKHYRRNSEDDTMPIVMLIGLYHGNMPYRGPKVVAERIKGPKERIPNRWKDQDMILIDLCTFSDEKLAVGGKLAIFLLVLKHIYDKNIEETIRKLVPDMRSIDSDQDGRDFLISMITYLYEATNTEKWKEIEQIAVESLSKETGGEVMTVAERHRKIALNEGRAEVALKMIEDGMDLETVAKYSGLTMEVLEGLREKAS